MHKFKNTKKAQFDAMTPEERRSRVECMVQANIGAKRSDETRKKQSDSIKKYLTENPRIISEERKKKTSQTISQQKWCNDGVRNYRLKEIPENFIVGKIKKRGP